MGYQTYERAPLLGKYYFVADTGEVRTTHDMHMPDDQTRYDFGNYFIQRLDAEAYRETIMVQNTIQRCLKECRIHLSASQLALSNNHIVHVVNCTSGFELRYLNPVCEQMIIDTVGLDRLKLYFGC